MQSVLVAGWVWYSFRCAVDPEPWGEIAQVANGMNILAVVFVVYQLVKFNIGQRIARAYGRGYDAGVERAAATLHGRIQLAAALKASGHEVKVLGRYQEGI